MGAKLQSTLIHPHNSASFLTQSVAHCRCRSFIICKLSKSLLMSTWLIPCFAHIWCQKCFRNFEMNGQMVSWVNASFYWNKQCLFKVFVNSSLQSSFFPPISSRELSCQHEPAASGEASLTRGDFTGTPPISGLTDVHKAKGFIMIRGRKETSQSTLLSHCFN